MLEEDSVSHFYWRGWEEVLGGSPVIIEWDDHYGAKKNDKEMRAAYEMGKADAEGALRDG